jgi:glutamate-1-semialdehyde 2,1-aminomutase
LSGNPIAMTAGLATIEALDEAAYARLEALGAQLERGLRAALDATGVAAQLYRVGSMWTLFFTGRRVFDYATAKTANTKQFNTYFHACLERGVYLPPSQFEAAFISLAHTPDDIQRTVEVMHQALKAVKAM